MLLLILFLLCDTLSTYPWLLGFRTDACIMSYTCTSCPIFLTCNREAGTIVTVPRNNADADMILHICQKLMRYKIIIHSTPTPSLVVFLYQKHLRYPIAPELVHINPSSITFRYRYGREAPLNDHGTETSDYDI